MCFGNSQTATTNTNSSYTPASYLSGAAQNNLNFASNLQSTGFNPYQGQQVAGFSPQQAASFGMGTNIAGAVSPTLGAATTSLGNAAGIGQTTVNAPTISSMMSPYMNQYVQMALNPQIANANNQFALNQQLTQGQATSAGAFGDPRAAMLQQNQQLNNNLSMQGLVGNAYNAAFNTAIGAGAQDVSNNINAQVATGQLGLGYGNEQLGAASGILGANTTAANLQNTFGSQQTAQSQAQLNALYNQWLMAQQYPFQTTQLMNSAISAATPASPSTSASQQVTTQPNNSGYGILGALGGAALNAFLPGAGTALSSVLGSGANTGYVSPTNSAGNPVQYVPYGNGNYYPMYAKGGRPKPGQPAIVGEKGPELFVPDDHLLHRAFGGPVPSNMPTMVGERGPEMFVPRGAGAPVRPVQGAGPMQIAGRGITPGTTMPMPDPGVGLGMPIQQRARGGPVKSGQPTIVGENGPEIITPQQSGTVIPYEKLREALKKKKGVATKGLAAQLGAAA